jgi:hypothetical protein
VSATPAAEGRDDFASGTSGEIFGIRATSKALAVDGVRDLARAVRGEPYRLRRAAASWPRRRVLALGIERAEEANLLAAARRELERSRHDVRFVSTTAGDRGKFENLNELLVKNPPVEADWLLVLDDDVALPGGFLDAFVFLAERFDLALAQPAHRARSHAAWAVTRRQARSVVRETGFVEIGPVFAFRAPTFDVMLPFPELRFGWGLDLHWSSVARAHGWRLGVIDATPIRHGLRRIASAYDRRDAVAETRAFLADHPYTPAVEAQRTLASHRSWT